MKKNYLNPKKTFLLSAGMLLLSLPSAFSQAVTTTTFAYTGTVQSFVVPQCVNSVTIEVWGAEGGGSGISNNTASGIGGKGGYSIGTLTVIPNSTLGIYVGGFGQSSTSGLAAGGWNGGGSGYASSSSEPGNGGGGATDVRVNGQAFSNRVIIAGGGGGGGEDSGDNYGNGGGTTGVGSVYSYDATQTAAGPGGALGVGGSTGQGDGGGGGGGYYGGGTIPNSSLGSDCQGGGGGSGYIGGVTSATTTDGTSQMPNPAGGTMFGRSGNGFVRLTYSSGNGMTVSSSSSVICTGSNATLTAAGVVSYTWSNSTVSPSISVNPTSNQSYTVTGTNSVGCTASLVVNVAVNQTVPSLTVVNTGSVAGGLCLGKTVTLTASGALSYTWAGGSVSVTNGQSFAPTTTNTYVVSGSNACGTTTAATAVTITPLTVAAVTSSSLVCSGGISTLTAFSGVSGYTWQPGNGIGGTNIVSTIVNTIYTVTASDGTCAGTATVAVNANPNPSINIVASSSAVCIGESVTLTATGANNYTWVSTSNGTTTGQTSIVGTPTAPTMFYVTGDNNFNCFTTTGQIVLVKASPNPSATVSKTLSCAGANLTLNATSDGPSVFQWDANANSANTASTAVNPTQTTVYTVTVTLNATSCSAVKTIQANIYSPTLSVTQPTNTCYGGQVTLTATINNPSSNSAANYTWMIPGMPNSNGTSAVVTATALTIYSVTANSTSLTALSCPVTKTTSIGIFYNPTITATPQRTFVCRNERVKLIGGGGVSYNWNNNQHIGDTLSLLMTSQGTFTYMVVGTDANGCSSTGTLTLKVQGCSGIEELDGALNSLISVYPNPSNGEFNLVTEKDMDVKIINDLGQLVRSYKLSALNNYQIQVTDLAKGIYFIVGENNSALSKQKIIVK